MKKIFFILSIICCSLIQNMAISAENTDISKSELAKIGFHKRLEISSQQQIKEIFSNYQKYMNTKELDKFLGLYDSSYKSSDGYDKETLKKLAIEVIKNYPDMKYDIKVLSVNVDVDNATVITKEKLNVDVDNATVITKEKLYATTDSNIEYIKGKGYIDAESTNIYYLKRFSNEWKITSDFIINEKTAMRYGLAKFVPMLIDAPATVTPDTDYTAVLKINLPSKYKALIAIDNEPISYPAEKIPNTFRGLKPSGIQERILYSNKENKNENATASVGIVKADIKDDNINVNIVGLAFLTSRVNVIPAKVNSFKTVGENKTIEKNVVKNESK